MNLDELIPSYAVHKEEEGKLKKMCDIENAQIKDIMSKENIKKHEAGGYSVTYSESVREKMNEDKLIELLKSKFTKSKLKELKLIKTVEVIDENALENAIYNNLVPESFITDMASCKESTVVAQIRVTKKKEA